MSNTTSLSDISEAYVSSISNSANEPEWITERRREAFARFSSLPLEVSPLYSKYSDANRIRPQNVRFTIADEKPQLSEYLTERLKELKRETGILQVGKHTVHISTPDKVTNEGVIVSPLGEEPGHDREHQREQ